MLITTYQEVNDPLGLYSCCDDENERVGRKTCLPEQHFLKTKMKIYLILITLVNSNEGVGESSFFQAPTCSSGLEDRLVGEYTEIVRGEAFFLWLHFLEFIMEN